MKKFKILSLVMALMFVFSSFSPGLSVFADEPATSPEPEMVLEALPEITQFEIKVNEETGEQVPSFAISVNEGTPYEEIGFPSALNAKIDNGEEWTKVPVIEWLQKSNSRFVPEGYLSYVPVFDGDAYSIKEGIAVPYGAVEFKAEEAIADAQDALQEALAEKNIEESSDELGAIIETFPESIPENIPENISEPIENEGEVQEEVKDADSKKEVLSDNDADKKLIRGFYFYEENGTYESPVKGADNVLFYLRLPAYTSVDNFLLPKYADAYIDDDSTPQRVEIVRWEKSDRTFESLPSNAIVMEAIFPDDYSLDSNCDSLFGILLQQRRMLKAASGVGDSRVYRGESQDVESTLFKWKKDWTYHGTSSFQVTTKFEAGDALKVNIHYFKDASGNRISDIQAYCLEQRWPGPKTTSNTESNYGVIADVKTLEAVYGATNANKLRAILDYGYPMTTTINGVTWSAEEARQITQNAIRCFLADINEPAAYQAFSSANIGTYIEDTKNGTAMAAIAYLVGKATRAERFEPQLTLQNTVISLTKSGSNYVGETSVTTNMSLSAITVLSDSVTAIGGSVSLSDGKLRVTIPESKINNADGLSITLRYNNPKKVVDSHAYFYEPSRRKPKSTRQALLGVNVTQSYDSKSVTLQAPRSGDIEIIKKSSLGNQINGNDCYSLAGAEFELRDASGNKVGVTMVTDANGYAKQTGIDAGTYTLVETKAPKGHAISNSPKTVTIGGPIVTVEWVDEAKNDPASIVINKIDKDCIYTLYIELKNISFENECLSSIESSVNFYFSTSDFVNLDGLIHFGIRDFNNKVKNKISDAVNSFIVEKEYEKFLDMLKEYIETSKSKIYRIHLIYLNSIATLLDDNGKEIELENISANHILSDFDFSKNDYVLNTLISLAPKEIILHLLSPSDNFIDAISQIFSSRVKICKDCEYCKKYHDDI